MPRNYFKTAWRNLVNNKVYSTLNILGLATGMAVALLIGLWVKDQSSYDQFLPNYQQAYQIKYNYNNNGEIHTQTEVCIPLAQALKNDIPEIAYTALTFGPATYGSLGSNLKTSGPPGQTATAGTPETGNATRATGQTTGDKRIAPSGLIAGPDFLKIFQYPMIEGNADDALRDPTSIVLTQSTARALFGNIDPMNKIVRRDNTENLKVTGVIKDLPHNSSFHFDYITSFDDFAASGWVKAATTNWNHSFFQLYIGLQPNAGSTSINPNTNPDASVDAKIKLLVKKYAPQTYQTFQQQVIMQPLKDWHLYTEYKNGMATGGLIDYVRLFSTIGVLVLLIACINFMNLSTARSEKRAKEVGVRKVIGSTRRGLIAQFLIESIVMTALAFALSLLLVQFVLPAVNTMTRASINIPYSNGWFWLIMLSYVLFTGPHERHRLYPAQTRSPAKSSNLIFLIRTTLFATFEKNK